MGVCVCVVWLVGFVVCCSYVCACSYVANIQFVTLNREVLNVLSRFRVHAWAAPTDLLEYNVS